MPQSNDNGKNLENAVFLQLHRKCNACLGMAARQRSDFVATVFLRNLRLLLWAGAITYTADRCGRGAVAMFTGIHILTICRFRIRNRNTPAFDQKSTATVIVSL